MREGVHGVGNQNGSQGPFFSHTWPTLPEDGRKGERTAQGVRWESAAVPQASGPQGQLKFWFSSSVLWPPRFLATTWTGFDLAEKTGGPPKPLASALVSLKGLVAVKVKIHFEYEG